MKHFIHQAGILLGSNLRPEENLPQALGMLEKKFTNHGVTISISRQATHEGL